MTPLAPPIVIKYGGSLLDDKTHRADFLTEIAALSRTTPVWLVHGGGKEISRQMEQAGLKPRFVNGRRFTDEATLAVVEKALQGLNGEVVKILQGLGVPAKGYSGRDGHCVEATAVQGLGRVGIPSNVDANALAELLEGSVLPVFYSIAEDAARQPLNINADDFALALAVASRASRLVYLTDTGGVMDRNQRVIPEIYDHVAERLIDDGAITGGMVVKVRACIDALKRGCGKVDLDKDVKFLLAGQAVCNGTTIALRKPAPL